MPICGRGVFDTKERSYVSGGGYGGKNLGKVEGSIRAPQWKGGGVGVWTQLA